MAQLNRKAQILASAGNVIPPQNSWADLCRRIEAHEVVPVIGNSLRNNRVFEWYTAPDSSPGPDQPPEPEPPPATVDEILAQSWASQLKYPLQDISNLARVALYNRVLAKDDEHAAVTYLNFLKGALLTAADNDPTVKAQVPALQTQMQQKTFSDLAVELDYPRFAPGQEDPLRLLARLPLGTYITTSYYNFLERALQAEGRDPRTQVCYWRPEKTQNVEDDHKTDYDFRPDKDHPVVYHLFGWEKYPATLVLSEADYLDYLLTLIDDLKSTKTNATKPVLPTYVQEALCSSSLILIGYSLQDWDFRVLYRLIRNSDIKKYRVLVQVDPKSLANGNLPAEQVESFLELYFHDTFALQWDGPDKFVYQLDAEYKKWTPTDS